MDTRPPLRRRLTELVAGIFGCFGRKKPALTRCQLSFGTLPEELSGLRLVAFSDLHGRQFGPEQQYLLEAIAAEQPEAILISGDLVERGDDAELRELGALMRALTGLAPVYFAPGNHETRLAPERFERLRELLEENGCVFLCGKSASLRGGAACLGGVRSKADSSLRRDTETDPGERESLRAAAEDARGRFFILLAHRPELFRAYQEAGADLVFSGHAHGGLFPLGRGGLLAPGQGIFPRRVRGLFCEGAMQQLVSTGLGGPRICVKAEIVSVVLYKSYPQREKPLK